MSSFSCCRGERTDSNPLTNGRPLGVSLPRYPVDKLRSSTETTERRQNHDISKGSEDSIFFKIIFGDHLRQKSTLQDMWTGPDGTGLATTIKGSISRALTKAKVYVQEKLRETIQHDRPHISYPQDSASTYHQCPQEVSKQDFNLSRPVQHRMSCDLSTPLFFPRHQSSGSEPPDSFKSSAEAPPIRDSTSSNYGSRTTSDSSTDAAHPAHYSHHPRPPHQRYLSCVKLLESGSFLGANPTRFSSASSQQLHKQATPKAPVDLSLLPSQPCWQDILDGRTILDPEIRADSIRKLCHQEPKPFKSQRRTISDGLVSYDEGGKWYTNGKRIGRGYSFQIEQEPEESDLSLQRGRRVHSDGLMTYDGTGLEHPIGHRTRFGHDSIQEEDEPSDVAFMIHRDSHTSALDPLLVDIGRELDNGRAKPNRDSALPPVHPSKSEASGNWEQALKTHAETLSKNRPALLPSTQNSESLRKLLNESRRVSRQASSHSSRSTISRKPVPYESTEQRYVKRLLSESAEMTIPRKPVGSGSSSGSSSSWERHPSHARDASSGSAGAEDGVVVRDFGSVPDSSAHPDNSLMVKSKNKGGRRMPPLEAVKQGFGRFTRSRSMDYRLHNSGHRSSIATGGTLEFPELEIR